MTGALTGIYVLEFAGLGPAPFCAMMLADHGAEVVRISRPGQAALAGQDQRDFLTRSRRNIGVDLKHPEGQRVAQRLAARADILIEGFRPGVMERLGLGPDAIMTANPRLVYGRMTGWGQDGPYAAMAGHDINYIALSGALHAIGRDDDRPVPPLNLVGDFGGGGMMLAFGVLAALQAAARSGAGQVVDCSMVDGSAVLMSMMYSLKSQDAWVDRRGSNMLDGGAPYYDTYRTADGLYVAVGAVEPQFFALLLDRLGFTGDPRFARQNDRSDWPEQRRLIEAKFLSRSRDEWCQVFEGTDACLAPVLSLDEAPAHPHNRHRRVFIPGSAQPAPAPKMQGTPARTPAPMRTGPDSTRAVLEEIGYSGDAIAELRKTKAID